MHEIQSQRFHVTNKLFSNVVFNCFFARSVIESHVTGQVFVDDGSDPKTAYIRHPYGMSLLIGCHTNGDFNDWLFDYIAGGTGRKHSDDWMQVFPFEWNDVIGKEVEARGLNRYIEKSTRVNFTFNRRRYETLSRPLTGGREKIEKIDRARFTTFQGTVVPKLFWDSYDDLDRHGIAYAVTINGEAATIAYAAFVHQNKLEIGIETAPRFRQKGLAVKACARLIDYCLFKNLEPVWACKLENTRSYKLAVRLGFDEEARYPYYGLKNPNPGQHRVPH